MGILDPTNIFAREIKIQKFQKTEISKSTVGATWHYITNLMPIVIWGAVVILHCVNPFFSSWGYMQYIIYLLFACILGCNLVYVEVSFATSYF